MFVFPDDARWDEAAEAVVFSVEVGEYRGSCFVPRRLFHDLIGHRPTPEDCVQRFHLDRTEFERLAEHKIVARELDDDANIRLSMRDLRRFQRG